MLLNSALGVLVLPLFMAVSPHPQFSRALMAKEMQQEELAPLWGAWVRKTLMKDFHLPCFTSWQGKGATENALKTNL